MINRMYFKNNLSFAECELEFVPGLNVLSGSSGAGKSVIFKSILSAFGLSEATAAILSLESSLKIDDESLLSHEVNVYAFKKEKSLRYFYNHQSVSKKLLKEHLEPQIIHLGAKSYDELSGVNLLKAIDQIALKESGFKELYERFVAAFKEYEYLNHELSSLEEDEAKISELSEFLSYEISKIQSAELKIGEYDELMQIKSKLSKVDKLKRVIDEASGIFNYTHKVQEALRLLEVNEERFIDLMSELEDEFNSFSAIEDDYDIEAVLDRLEQLKRIISKYGSEEEALKALEQKKAKLEQLGDVEFNKAELKRKISKAYSKAKELADNLSEYRKKASFNLAGKMNEYLKSLYLKNLSLVQSSTNLKASGQDEFRLRLKDADFKDISSGELNRIRLAFLAAKSALSDEGGVIFLDEVDANLSGKEAISIAKVITDLAKNYQIFAITHLPWLCARASRHILVEKQNEQSSARVLKANEIEGELARMISDESTNESARTFARALLDAKTLN